MIFLISVIIPMYNAGVSIRRCLESVMSQRLVPGWTVEILVIDDCSTDDSLAVVAEMNLPQPAVIRQECNQGPAAARNRGLAEARGEYCAFLDADDYWDPDFLSETVSFLTAHPEAVAVSVMQCHKIPGKSDAVSPRWDGDDTPRQLTDFFDFWAKYNHVCTGAVLMRTLVARQSGGQREDLRICEDLEFWALLATYGNWGFIPKVLFTSDGGAVTREIGWWAKNIRRWQSAPTVEEWQRRIAARLSATGNPGFYRMRGRIAKNLCYSQLLSGRADLARQQSRIYGKDFPNDKLGKILRTAARYQPLWLTSVFLLNLRERIR